MLKKKDPLARALFRELLHLAQEGGPAPDFLRLASSVILRTTRATRLDLMFHEDGQCYAWQAQRGDPLRSHLCPRVEPEITCETSRSTAHSVARIRLDGGEADEFLSEMLELSLVSRRTHAALRERVKELTCLSEIGRVSTTEGLKLEQAVQQIVDLLPPAWQFPDRTSAAIHVDEQRFATQSPQFHAHTLVASIVIAGEVRGRVEVSCDPEHEGLPPFLAEEEHLIHAIAREVAILLERRETAKHRLQLEAQVRRVERLATVGQLAAGVAHELNEPLSGILGFVQLAAKAPGLPRQAAQDLDRAVTSALYARDVIKKLMLFARQAPATRVPVEVNRVVEAALALLEPRCRTAGITATQEFAARTPVVSGDGAQLQQVLVNLLVNSIQSMPGGGQLWVRTRLDGGEAVVEVEDQGIGMGEEVINQIFLPFFTTKDVGQGTGLGLAIVHGIVAAHGGSIDVKSRVGEGTRFDVRIPQQAVESASAT